MLLLSSDSTLAESKSQDDEDRGFQIKPAFSSLSSPLTQTCAIAPMSRVWYIVSRSCLVGGNRFFLPSDFVCLPFLPRPALCPSLVRRIYDLMICSTLVKCTSHLLFKRQFLGSQFLSNCSEIMYPITTSNANNAISGTYGETLLSAVIWKNKRSMVCSRGAASYFSTCTLNAYLGTVVGGRRGGRKWAGRRGFGFFLQGGGKYFLL